MAPASALPDGVEPAALEEIACRVARAAGRLVVEERPDDLGVASKSSATDPVTVMDQRSQELIVDLLATARPDDAVLGEEEGGSTGTSGLTWVIDPIDGTVNYLYGIPAYAVSVAVVTGDPSRPGSWSSVAGAVLNPETGELFHAHVGGGARLTTDAGTRTPARHGRHRRGTRPRRHRFRLRRRPCGAGRQPCSSTSCRRCATSGGTAVRPSTCAAWPSGGSTRTTRARSTRGTGRPVSSSPARPGRCSAGRSTTS